MFAISESKMVTFLAEMYNTWADGSFFSQTDMSTVLNTVLLSTQCYPFSTHYLPANYGGCFSYCIYNFADWSAKNCHRLVIKT